MQPIPSKYRVPQSEFNQRYFHQRLFLLLGHPVQGHICGLRRRCLKHPERTEIRQVAFFIGRAKGAAETYTEKMKRKIDTACGRFIYCQRLGTVEPVFANIFSTKLHEPVYPARQAQGHRAMAVVLYRTQHRKNRQLCPNVCIESAESGKIWVAMREFPTNWNPESVPF